MSYIFTADEFAKKLLDIQKNYPTHYRGTWGSSAGQYNIGQWDGQNFCFDCSGVIKSVLWGWCGNKNKAYGGAVYCANGVPDINDDASWGFGKYATHTDVLNAPKGALLWKQGHVGTSMGDGYAVECTPAFNGGVQRTAISGRGWSRWGYLPWINYDAEPEADHPTLQYGSTGSAVKELQTRLNYWGSYGLALDSSFGPATKSAVIDFQGKHGIGQDGIVGPKTWAELLKSKYKVGDTVKYNGIYTSSNSTSKLVPKYKEGNISQILEGAPNPYLISVNGAAVGWTNDSCIEGSGAEPVEGGLIDLFMEGLALYGDGRYHYYREWDGTGIGCSNYLCLGLKYTKKLLKDGEVEPWAAQCRLGVLSDTTRFKKIAWDPSVLQRGDILWSHGHHVAIWDGKNGVWEAAPESSHGICDNGKTGVGHWSSHTYYNCGTGTKTWTCIYRIIDTATTTKTETVVEAVEEKKEEAKQEATVKKLTARELADNILANKYGNGQARKDNLKALGYTDAEIRAAQDIVNDLCSGFDVDKVAQEIMAGKYGNGQARKDALKAKGYTDAQIQKAQQKVNELLS